MSAFLNFAPGPNQLPEPWQNLDPTHDIRKRLRFDYESASAILAEHVLEPGGVLRIAFPDVGRFLTTDGSELVLNQAALGYAEGLRRRVDLVGPVLERTRAALGKMLTGWGHQTAWTKRSAAGALLVVGFSRVCRCEYGHGELSGVDGHHRDVGPELALLESTILEAKK